MMCEFIQEHEGVFPVSRMCAVSGVSRSRYYAWKRRGPSPREKANARLATEIEVVYTASRGTYGSPRVHAALAARGVHCGRHRVARLMRAQGLAGRTPRRRRPITTRQQAGNTVAPNVLNRDFSATRPDQKWVADITYLDTDEGWLYLAVILDLFSRRVIGWSMADHLQTPLVRAALDMALASRHLTDDMIHHSDRGCQYTSAAYRERLDALGVVTPSMSRTGDCYDNAVAESFFGTLKTECACRHFASHTEARCAVFEFIEVWYNRQRLHSSLGYLSPEAFELQHALHLDSVH